MDRKLRDWQHAFATLLPELLAEAGRIANARGDLLCVREVWRSPETAAAYAAKGVGTKTSLHCDSVAVDLLFRTPDPGANTWVPVNDADRYLALGEFWEDLGKTRGEPTRWGGRFKKPDPGHFSLSIDGIRG